MLRLAQITCMAEGCGARTPWFPAVSPKAHAARCERCHKRYTLTLPTPDEVQLKTDEELGSVQIKFRTVKSFDEAVTLRRNTTLVYTDAQKVLLEKIWQSASEQDLLPALFEALMYIGGFSSGARFVSVEDASTPTRLSMEFVGLDKNGTAFIYIGAIYRPDDRNWSFHS